MNNRTDTLTIQGFAVDTRTILLDEYIEPLGYNPHRIRPWLFVVDGDGAVALVWATCEQVALDAVVDEGLMDRYQVEEVEAVNEDGDDLPNILRAGNASEPFDINETMRIIPVDWSAINPEWRERIAYRAGQGEERAG